MVRQAEGESRMDTCQRCKSGTYSEEVGGLGGRYVSSEGHEASAVCSVRRSGLLVNSDTQRPEEGKAEQAYAGIYRHGLCFTKQPSGQI